jgi:hypothetical protein
MSNLSTTKHFSKLVGVSLMISCTGTKNAGSIQPSDQIFYAGAIQSCLSIQDKRFIPYSIENGEIYYMDDEWFLKPYFPGVLNMKYGMVGSSSIQTLKYKVVQYPMPLFFLGTPPYVHLGDGEIKWYVSIVDTIGRRLKKNNRMSDQYPFRAESFSVKLFDQQDSLIFLGANSDYHFSLENEAAAKENLKYGHKFLIENIKFLYPDGSFGVGKIDTFIYRNKEK